MSCTVVKVGRMQRTVDVALTKFFAYFLRAERSTMTNNAGAMWLLLAGGGGVLAAAGEATLTTNVTFEPTQTWGVWEGWGTSLAWWANCYGSRDDLADAFFTMDTVKYTPGNGERRRRGHGSGSDIGNNGRGVGDDAGDHQKRRANGGVGGGDTMEIPGLGFTIARYNIGGAPN